MSSSMEAHVLAPVPFCQITLHRLLGYSLNQMASACGDSYANAVFSTGSSAKSSRPAIESTAADPNAPAYPGLRGAGGQIPANGRSGDAQVIGDLAHVSASRRQLPDGPLPYRARIRNLHPALLRVSRRQVSVMTRGLAVQGPILGVSRPLSPIPGDATSPVR